MKKIILLYFLFFSFVLSSCAVVGGIFKAGVWVGALIVIAIVGLIIYLVMRGSNKG